MQSPRIKQSRRLSRPLLHSIIGIAILLRLASAFYFGNQLRVLPGVADQLSYHNLAIRVMSGHGFTFETGWWPATPAGQPTAHWSYLYVVFVSAIYSLFGPNPLVPRLIQALAVGFLQPWLTWRVGRKLFGTKVGLVSAALASVYAYFVFYAGALMTESFYIVALLWTVDVSLGLTQSRKSATAKSWAQLGLALGIAVLLRQVALLLIPPVFAWIAWRSRGAGGLQLRNLRGGLGRAAIALAVLAACILPWTLRNVRVFGQFVLLNTNAGFAFFWGNHPIHGTEFIPVIPESLLTYGALIPNELRGLNEAAMDRALLSRGVQIVANDPVRYARLCVSRAREYVRFWPSRDSGSISNFARVSSFGLLLPLLLAGTVLAFRRQRPTARRKCGAGFVMLLAAVYSFVHLLTWTLVRYRLPVDAITLPIAALALAQSHAWLRRRFGVAVPRLAPHPVVCAGSLDRSQS
jgi:hypothetical protein